MPSRRTVVTGFGAALLTGTAGCGAFASPEPTVVDTTVAGGLDALIGEMDIYVTVQNDGAAGDVVVELTLLDDQETILYEDAKTVAFGADERRRITFSVDIPEGTETVEATAQPA